VTRALALSLALGAVGCGSSAPITVHFSGSNATPAPGAGYTAPTGTVGSNQDMQLVLDSKAGGAELLVQVDPPALPMPIAVGTFHLDVEYTLSPHGPTWVSNSGSITFQTVQSPYQITFDHLEMIGSAATGASGAFFIDGNAEYSK
jgi:hypothetical protein